MEEPLECPFHEFQHMEQTFSSNGTKFVGNNRTPANLNREDVKSGIFEVLETPLSVQNWSEILMTSE